MSKRNSNPGANTLFNYFTKTPPCNKKLKPSEDSETDNVLNSPVSSKKGNKTESKKRERQATPSPDPRKSDSEDDVPVVVKKRKRIRLNPVDSDDSDIENKVDNKIGSPEDKVSLSTRKLQDNFTFGSPKSASPKVTKTKKIPNEAQPTIKEEPTSQYTEDGNWVHCKLDWLKPEKIRDATKRKPDHPDYDPSTLYVPPDFMKSQTPAHRQWWEMKSKYYDCVLFFKVGKFYELYHMDAAVGVNELGFSYMKGDFAHSGFPESAYSRMASTLISKGYKVARIEQTETPEMMQERCKRNGTNSKFDKVVSREVCQIGVRGVQTGGLAEPLPSSARAEYLFGIAEEEYNGVSKYGVCFVDTTTGQVYIGQFEDDKHSSRLLTTVAHYPPALIVFDRKTTSARTSRLLSTHCHSARREPTTLWAPEKTLKILAEKYYKTDGDGKWPTGITPFLHEGDVLGLTPAANCSLAVQALGGCVLYLTQCLLDIQVLGMAQYNRYVPPDMLNSTLTEVNNDQNDWQGGSTMVLDAITLKNLRIVQDEGCLYDRLNFCSTAMGKRLLHQWLCSPSCNISVIKERQKAVKMLFENQELCQDVKAILTSLPDLERLLAKIHILGNSTRAKCHPDSRAIFYEEKTYSKRKVLDFILLLNGFTSILKLVDLFSDVDAELLKKLTQFAPEGRFPDYRDTLKFFKEGFNQQEAEKEGRILPGSGVDADYDNTIQLIQNIQDELKEYLSEQERYFKCRLTYVGSDKKRYQIEVPQSAAGKANSDYHLEGARKGFKRYSTVETKDLLARMIAAEEKKSNVLKDLSRRMFEKFSSHQHQWEMATKCVATIDILLAFTEFARQQTGDICLPEITYNKDQEPYIDIVEGRHPCISIPEFIPNDTRLGVDNPRLLLLTGPNMGGKSTLMRQVGLLTVLAHLGCHVPASECRLSVCDRIFTRLGASDDILSGQSTFLVEMNETAAIVKHATKHSLVLLDELGRGTSTYDGTCIAWSVCWWLAGRSCRTLFSTHYHSLVHHLADHPAVLLGHMACMVETDESAPDGDHIPEETITFLYKLSPGACPKSYGFNAARLAGIPREITQRAHTISRNLESEATCVRAFRDVIKTDNAAELRKILSALTI
ncbi:probable DNA mismatch repair protein Msh6 isoform X1 [Danaus plexippus]|uniref:probable DNA mismatch repair protein Msh6 isoform X1 n=1 Tax=Danaus plexippus TaxID=13037 RepID=UPI002AB030B2|nr:probable DNA mismatch repair protein Msh6 isoform X1 [Danaus plexippus]